MASPTPGELVTKFGDEFGEIVIEEHEKILSGKEY